MSRHLQHRRLVVVTAAISIVLAGTGLTLVAQATQRYAARLARVAIDATALTTVTGQGSVTADLKGNVLTIAGSFKGLALPATAAHLHRGIARGVRGNALTPLEVTKDTEGTIKGVLTLSPDQLADLQQGRLYVQVNGDKTPEGNLWGWILPAVPPRKPQ